MLTRTVKYTFYNTYLTAGSNSPTACRGIFNIRRHNTVIFTCFTFDVGNQTLNAVVCDWGNKSVVFILKHVRGHRVKESMLPTLSRFVGVLSS